MKHKKADDNERLARIDVNKALDNANQKFNYCEKARQFYADALEVVSTGVHVSSS